MSKLHTEIIDIDNIIIIIHNINLCIYIKKNLSHYIIRFCKKKILILNKKILNKIYIVNNIMYNNNLFINIVWYGVKQNKKMPKNLKAIIIKDTYQ